jgi:hypothetical protein
VGKHRAVSLDPLIDRPFGGAYEVDQARLSSRPARRSPSITTDRVGDAHADPRGRTFLFHPARASLRPGGSLAGFDPDAHAATPFRAVD